MPRLKVEIDDQQLDDTELREGFSLLASDDEARNLVRAMLCLMKEGHLGFWLSSQLMRRLKEFALKQESAGQAVSGEVDQEVLFSWLEQGGHMNQNVRWEVESLPNNGGIYRMLLEGGQHEKGIYTNEG